MFQLKLFGVPSLSRDGAILTGRAAQRHRLALLALLATAPDRRLTRDKLIAYLWPESGADRGRNLLKVATYVLRTELGEDTLVSTGDELRLNPDLIRIDVADFDNALEQSDHARAVTLYTGPFLDGFFLSDAPDFEKWVDGERDRLTGGYRNALEALADTAERAADHPKAVEWWKVRAAQDPYDSRVAQRLMLAFEASGNRAGALQHAHIHQRMLQEEFGVAPHADIVTLVERLRQEPVREVPLPMLAKRTDAVEIIEKQEKRPAPVYAPKRRPQLFAAVTVLLVLVGAVWAVWPRGADPEQSIVVLPFLNMSGDPDNEYFSDGLTEEIITRLAAIPGLKVISRTSAMHYKGSKKPLPEIAGELRVDHILEGSVQSSDGTVKVSAQLIDARVDGHLWAKTYAHTLSNSFRVQEEIAGEVANALEMRLGARARRLLVRQGTQDAEAYQLVQRARYLWNTRTREGHERAIEYYRQAIERDSTYADAYAGLANVYFTGYQLTFMPESEAYNRLNWAAGRALALDNESADAHLALAVGFLWQRNWPGAEREFKRSIELNPGHATAYSWYSVLLRAMGRGEDSWRESSRAVELDPFGLVINNNHGWHLYHMRDYDGAIEQLQRALELQPFPVGFRSLGMAYAHKEMWQEAISAVRRAVELAPERPEFLADLAYVLARAGQTDEARARLREAKLTSRDGFNIGRAHVALHEPDSALVWLERSNWHWPNRGTRDDPGLDPLRNDARFKQLVQRVDREMGVQ